MQKEYLGGVAATTLASDMTDVATTFTVASGGGSDFPTGASYPFVVVIGRDTPSEELILCSSRSGDTFTVSTRGYDGTTAVAHTGGPVVEHCIDAGIVNEASAHIYDTSAAHAASAISYAGGTGMSATDVEAAIDELATEKANLSGGTFTGDISVPDEAYDATAWNGSVEVPTKNAVRDKIETLASASASTIVRKTADQSRSSVASPTADSELLFAIGANETFVGRFVLFVGTGDEAADLRVDISVPSGATADYGWQSLAPASTDYVGSLQAWGGSSAGGVGIDASFGTLAVIYFAVSNGATAGNVTLLWSQNSSSATATTIKRGSHLVAEKIT